MNVVELFEHQLAVVGRLHVAVRRTAHKDKPVGVGINRKIEIRLAEIQHALAAILAFVARPLQNFMKAFEDVHACGKKKLFLVSIMMGQQPESHSRTFGNLLERGFGIAAFAKKFLRGLQQGLLLRHGHMIPPKNMIKKQRCLVAQPTDYATGFRSSTEKYASCERRSYTVQKRIAPFFSYSGKRKRYSLLPGRNRIDAPYERTDDQRHADPHRIRPAPSYI